MWRRRREARVVAGWIMTRLLSLPFLRKTRFDFKVAGEGQDPSSSASCMSDVCSVISFGHRYRAANSDTT